MKKCNYCDAEYESDIQRCAGCGAKLIVANKECEKPLIEKDMPFAYNGLIVFCNRNYARDEYEFMFYAGDRLLATIPITGDLIKHLIHNDRGIDFMFPVWKLFEVVVGERDHWIIQSNKEVKPSVLHVVVRTAPECNLTWEEVIEMYKMQQMESGK